MDENTTNQPTVPDRDPAAFLDGLFAWSENLPPRDTDGHEWYFALGAQLALGSFGHLSDEQVEHFERRAQAEAQRLDLKPRWVTDNPEPA